jgi:hypothetical protein
MLRQILQTIVFCVSMLLFGSAVAQVVHPRSSSIRIVSSMRPAYFYILPIKQPYYPKAARALMPPPIATMLAKRESLRARHQRLHQRLEKTC